MIASPKETSLRSTLQIGFHQRVILYVVKVVPVRKVNSLADAEQWSAEGSADLLADSPENRLPVVGGYC